MGLKCQISFNKEGKATVMTKDGSPSTLYNNLLDTLGNQEAALDYWASAYSEDFANFTDAAEENATVNDVLRYYNALATQEKKLSTSERWSVESFMKKTGIQKLSSLVTTMNDIFYKDGAFFIDGDKAVRSGLYSRDEIESIDVPAMINLLQKLNGQVMTEDFFVFPESSKYKFKNTEAKTIFGTYETVSEDTITNEILEAIEDASQVESVIQTLPYTDFVEDFNDKPAFRKKILSRFEGLKKVPVVAIDRGLLVEDNIEEQKLVENTIEDNIPSANIEAEANYLETIDDDVWEIMPQQITDILEEIEDDLIDHNIDVIGMKSFVGKKQEIISLLRSIARMAKNPTTENIKIYAEAKKNLFGQKSGKAKTFIKSNSKLSLFKVNTNLSESQLFDQFGLIKVEDGLYHKVKKSENAALYDFLYKQMKDGTFSIPQEYRTFEDINDKESVIKAITSYVFSLNTTVRPDLAENYILHKLVFGHQVEPSVTKSIENFRKSSNITTDQEYLKTEFVTDFYNYILTEKKKDSELYREVLQHFSISDDDISLKRPIASIQNLEMSVELADYIRLKRDSSMNYLLTDDITAFNQDLFYLNHPEHVKELSVTYRQQGDYILADTSNNTWVKSGGELYKVVYSSSGRDLFKKINTKPHPLYYNITDNFAFDINDAKEIVQNMLPAKSLYTKLQEKKASIKEYFLPSAAVQKQVMPQIDQTAITQPQILEAVLSKLSESGLANNVYQMTSAELESKLLELGVEADVARQVSAWHGSPHSFARFTTAAMGTGEGVQAFGWGLYFTDLESIARNYANNENLIERHLNSVYEFGAPDRFYQIPKESRKNKESLVTYIDTQIEGFKGNAFQQQEWQKLKDAVSSYTPSLYKVSLHKGKTPSEYTWLEWDKNVPLSVGEKIEAQIIKEYNLNYADNQKEYEDGFYEVENEYGDTDTKNKYDGIKGELAAFYSGDNGNNIYTELSKSFGGKPLTEEEELWNTVYNERDTKNDKRASLFLLRAGIDGIKFPAESISRGATSDTARGFNYVVFDENAITIEEHIQFQKALDKVGVSLTTAGFTYQNDVYLNSENPNILNTALHEHGHLMLDVLKENRLDVYNAGLKLVEKNTAEAKNYIDYVKQTQPSLVEGTERFNNEVLAQVIGDSGERLINSKKKDSLSNWLSDLWNSIKEILGISNYTADQVSNMTLEEFGRAVNAEMLSGENYKNQFSRAAQYFTREADRLPLTLAVFETKPFKDLIGKNVKPITIKQLLNKTGIKQIEKDLINGVLDKSYVENKQYSYDEIEAAVRAGIMPLERLTTSSYASYGMNNLGDYGDAKTLIFNTPIEHGVTGHFRDDFTINKRKEAKYVAKPLDANTWVAVEEGYENQGANENNIYQFVGTAGTREDVDAWIEARGGYTTSNTSVREYDDAYGLVDNKTGRTITYISANDLPGNISPEGIHNTLLDSAIIEGDAPINQGMFGHIRVWENTERNLKLRDDEAKFKADMFKKYGDNWQDKLSQEEKAQSREFIDNKRQEDKMFYAVELQSDFFQKNNAKRRIFENKQSEALSRTKKIFEDREASKMQEILQKMYDLGFQPGSSVNTFALGLQTPEIQNLKRAQENVRTSREWDAYEEQIEAKLQVTKDLVRQRNELINQRHRSFRDTKEFEVEVEKLLTPDEKQFIASQKEWEKRMVRETIKEAALSGATKLRFPTPYTLSVIEGYINADNKSDEAPYTIISGNDEILKEGDTIRYLDTEYIVVGSTGDTISVVNKEGDDYTYTASNRIAQDNFIESKKIDDNMYAYKAISLESAPTSKDTILFIEKTLDEKVGDFDAARFESDDLTDEEYILSHKEEIAKAFGIPVDEISGTQDEFAVFVWSGKNLSFEDASEAFSMLFVDNSAQVTNEELQNYADTRVDVMFADGRVYNTSFPETLNQPITYKKGVPYTIVSGNQERLTIGDKINFQGKDYTVIKSDEDNISVSDTEEELRNLSIEFGKLTSLMASINGDLISNYEINGADSPTDESTPSEALYLISEYQRYNKRRREINNKLFEETGEDGYQFEPNIINLKQPEFYTRDASETFKITNLSEAHQTVARKYEEIASILNKERSDVKIVKDSNGFPWYETKIEQEEINRPVVAFQKKFSNDVKLENYLTALSEKGKLERHPFTPRELIYNSTASIKVDRFDKGDRDEISLQNIFVYEKGTGNGSRVMQDIIDVADELGYKITLDAKPFGNDQDMLQIRPLVNFYENFGFKVDLSEYGGEFTSRDEMVDYAEESGEAVPMIRDTKKKKEFADISTVKMKKASGDRGYFDGEYDITFNGNTIISLYFNQADRTWRDANYRQKDVYDVYGDILGYNKQEAIQEAVDRYNQSIEVETEAPQDSVQLNKVSAILDFDINFIDLYDEKEVADINNKINECG